MHTLHRVYPSSLSSLPCALAFTPDIPTRAKIFFRRYLVGARPAHRRFTRTLRCATRLHLSRCASRLRGAILYTASRPANASARPRARFCSSRSRMVRNSRLPATRRQSPRSRWTPVSLAPPIVILPGWQLLRLQRPLLSPSQHRSVSINSRLFRRKLLSESGYSHSDFRISLMAASLQPDHPAQLHRSLQSRWFRRFPRRASRHSGLGGFQRPPPFCADRPDRPHLRRVRQWPLDFHRR